MPRIVSSFSWNLIKLLIMQKKDNKKTLDLINKVKTDLKKYRRQFEKNWIEEEDAYFGRIWKYTDGYRPYESHSFQIVESEVPILTDSYAKPVIKVKDPDLIDSAKNLDKSMTWVFKDQNLQGKSTDGVRKALTSGPAYFHPFYDFNADDGEGKEIIEVLDWKQVYLHGMTNSIDTCEKARIELDRTRTWLKLAYPKYEDQIDKVKTEDCQGDYDYEKSEGREKYDTGYYALRERPKKYRDEDTLILIKTYLRDYSTEKIPEEVTIEEVNSERESIENGEAPDVSKWQDHEKHIAYHSQFEMELYGQLGLVPDNGIEAAEQAVEQLAAQAEQQAQIEAEEAGIEPQDTSEITENYSNILYQIRMNELHIQEHEEVQKLNKKGVRLKYPSGLRVIESLGDVILYDGESKNNHNEIPLAPIYCYRNGTIYSFSEIRNIIDSERMQAIMLYKEYKGLQRVANPAKQIDIETGLTEEDITNDDGALYFTPQGTSIREIPPGSVSTQLNVFAERRVQSMQSISGINEATQGDTLHPNQSGEAITKLQQQAIGRIRLKSRELAETYRRLGFLVSSDIIQFWTSEKVLYMEDGNYEPVIWNPIEMEELKYEVDMAEGSMAGIDKDAYNAYLMRLMQGGQITFKQYATIADLPNNEKLLEFGDENDQTQAQQQEIQGQLEEIQAQLEQANQENMILRKKIDPAFLSNEEAKAAEEIERQEDIQQLVNNTGADEGQPV